MKRLDDALDEAALARPPVRRRLESKKESGSVEGLEPAVREKREKMLDDFEAFVRGGAYDALEDPRGNERPPYDDSSLEWNWHHDRIVRALELVADGEITRLGINISPGSLKSQMTNVFFPAWEWARDASIQRIVASTNSGNSKRDCMEARDLVRTDWYQTYFPEVEIKDDRDGKTDFGTTERGFYKATSVGSKDIGSHADRLHLDDPTDPLEVKSKARRQNALEWFREVFSDRLESEKESAIIVVGHRVHVKDLFAFLREIGGYEWLTIEEKYMPDFNPSTLLAQSEAEAESMGLCVGADPRDEAGEFMHPERRGPEEYERFVRTSGDRISEAKLQQNPEENTGNIIEESWPRIWTERPSIFEKGELGVFVEPAGGSKKEGTSDAVIQLAWSDWSEVYFLDERFGLWRQTDTEDVLRALMRGDPSEADGLIDRSIPTWWQEADRIYIENKANGPGIEDHLQGEDGIPKIILMKPWAGKAQRIEDVSGFHKYGDVYYPPRDMSDHVESWIEQVTSFPNVDKDDRADCSAYGIERYLGDRLEIEDRTQQNNDARKTLKVFG